MRILKIGILLASALFCTRSFSATVIKTAWECVIPCEVRATKEGLKPVRVSYCATSVISAQMLEDITPNCRDRNGRSDAVAVRVSKILNPASCVTSANTCKTDGLMKIGFSCSYFCPSQDKFVHKFAVCAVSSEDAWGAAVDVCKDAKSPTDVIMPLQERCTADGQTPCE